MAAEFDSQAWYRFEYNNELARLMDMNRRNDQLFKDVCHFMVAMAVQKVKGIDRRQIILLATAYSILMNIRCRELSLLQKMNAVLLSTGGATKRVC